MRVQMYTAQKTGGRHASFVALRTSRACPSSNCTRDEKRPAVSRFYEGYLKSNPVCLSTEIRCTDEKCTMAIPKVTPFACQRK